MNVWTWLIVIVVVVALLGVAVIAVQAQRRRGGVIVNRGPGPGITPPEAPPAAPRPDAPGRPE